MKNLRSPAFWLLMFTSLSLARIALADEAVAEHAGQPQKKWAEANEPKEFTVEIDDPQDSKNLDDKTKAYLKDFFERFKREFEAQDINGIKTTLKSTQQLQIRAGNKVVYPLDGDLDPKKTPTNFDIRARIAEKFQAWELKNLVAADAKDFSRHKITIRYCNT